MSLKSDIFLVDLSKQLPFNIDDALKKQICFGETLIISCGHVEGDTYDIFSDSECSCSESSATKQSEKVEDIKLVEIPKPIEEKVSDESCKDDDNFHFYFFPDCSKPPPAVHSKSSLIIKDGLPYINRVKHVEEVCTCKVDHKLQCNCFVKLPCICGANERSECTCSEVPKVCFCNELKPNIVCTCEEAEVCTCYPDGKLRVICTCDKVDRPCLCHPKKFPYPVCICKHKPVFDESTYDYEIEGENTLETSSRTTKSLCKCQDPIVPVPEKTICECDQKIVCACEPPCGTLVPDFNGPKLTCSTICRDTQECPCSNTNINCKSFAANKACTCGDSENCKCFKICECSDPCMCDVGSKFTKECTCLTKPADEIVEQLEGVKKLKKVRAGKHGYRFCHDVDPRHTYFGYGYGRHDKIIHKEEKPKKIEITDNAVKATEEVTEGEKEDLPVYNKKLGKLSLDCCSAVGGITINVETLGEDKGKFLVQVVSHSSKEAAKTGSKIVSIVDCKLHTLEENRSEYIEKKGKHKEKRNYMAICESGYYNKVTRICGDRHLIKRFYHTFEEAHNFLLEGANIVLMRYVGLTRYRGCIKTDTVLIDGTVCESIYVCLGVSHAVVNGKPFFVVKIERHIIEPSGYIHQTLLVLSLRGYVVSQEWANNSYVIHINPLLRVVSEKDEIEAHEPLRDTWRQDLQLLSDYLDFKTTRTSEGGRYVSENGELTGTIRDYLQAVLLLRPSDTLHFTRHYFGAALSALDLPHNEFFDPSTKHVRYFFFED
ncbi:uncharacterized protein [Battus philenor]|uniref:uncharacterized protein n=1 Tax=Battus philenor TaxID=42288 RepID=UPI0035CED11C